ncbi:MAG: hypothetical protein K2I67_01820 [Malacoplasma sp.]|nr:hypothetical protein [Mycoplasma sp.]MDE5553266.1 hypothetical protein [Malacoplasma sp.]
MADEKKLKDDQLDSEVKKAKDESKKRKKDEENTLDYEYDRDEFKKNLVLYSKIIDRSDEIVSVIYKFMNKTLDAPTKAEIELYRKSIIMALKKGNDKKYGYLYKIIAKNVYDYKEFVRDENQKAQNQVIINPNIFAISWDDLQSNIKDRLRNTDSDMISPESLEKAYKDELDKVKKLYAKLKDMRENGVEVSDDAIDMTRSTMLKLTDLVNVFMLENFDELQPMMQEIQIFEKYHSFTTDHSNSIFIDANFKNITNLSPPRKDNDAATKKYVDEQIEKVLTQLNSK